jgi:diketogulonate reductase-like aldo/keto reductase
MKNRRDFMKDAGLTATALSLPWASIATAQAQLARRKIPSTGEELPIVGFGNARVYMDGDMEKSRPLVQILREFGGSYCDCIFGARDTVASIIGEMNAADDLFLAPYIMGETDEESRSDIERLLDLSGKDSLDLAHAWNEYALPNWDRIRGWKEDGLARHIGVSRNASQHYDDIMKVMDTGTVDIVQVNYSALEREAEERVLPMAMDKGIAVTINRPFMNGDYFGLVSGHELPAWAADFDCETWAQFSLKFILSHPAVNCAITETSNPDHARDNLGAGLGRMPGEDERERIAAHLTQLAA